MSRAERLSPAALIAFVVVMVAAAALRLSHLGRDSAWIDEVLSINFSSGSLIEIAKRLEPQMLPLFFWINSFFLVHSTAEGWLRLSSALLGVAVVPVIFLIGVELGRVRVGLTAAALAAVSQFLISYSQEIRQYALMALLAMLGTWLTLRIRRDPSRANWAVLLGVSVLNLYTSPFAVFIVAIHWATVAVLVWRAREWRSRFLPCAMLLAVLYVPALFHMRRLLTGSATVLQDPAGDYSLVALATCSLNHFAGAISALAVLLAVSGIVGAVVAWQQCRAFAVIAVASFCLPISVLSVRTPGHAFNPRYVIFAQPHLLILAALAIVSLWDVAVKKLHRAAGNLDIVGPAALGVAVVIGLTQVTSGHELIGRKADWRSVMRRISDNLHDGDLIIVAPFYEDNSALYHLDELLGVGRRVRLTADSNESWYCRYHRNPRIAATPEEFRGPLITMTVVSDVEQLEYQLDHYRDVTGETWLIAVRSAVVPGDDFRTVLALAPVGPFSEISPLAGTERITLYRLERPSMRAAVDHSATRRADADATADR